MFNIKIPFVIATHAKIYSASSNLKNKSKAAAIAFVSAAGGQWFVTKGSSTAFVLADTQMGQSTTGGFGDVVLRSFVSAAGAGNGADATDDVLDTYNIPAKGFNATSGTTTQRIIGSAWGSVAANGNTKTLKLKVGSGISVTLNPTTTAPNNKTWFLDYEIVRLGSSTQCVFATLSFSGTAAEAVSFVTNGAETDTAAITVNLTGSSGSSAANDVLCNSHQAVFNN